MVCFWAKVYNSKISYGLNNPFIFCEQRPLNVKKIHYFCKYIFRLDPNFRTSYSHDEKVYFFFSESDIADFNNDVSFKVPTSYIGEICASDNGRMSFSESTKRFMTFKKTIINCYIPDYTENIHIKYTEIQEATKPIKTRSGSSFYAIFTIRRANNVDSALCVYKITSVENAMKGYYKNNPDKKPYKPLSCSNYKSLNNKETDEFYKDMTKNNKFQMEQTVNERALFALNNVKFTSIAIDLTSPESDQGHVIFIGLSDGGILKMINKPVYSAETNEILYSQPIIVNEYAMFENHLAVNNLFISVPNAVSNERKLIAVSSEQIKSMPVDIACYKYTTCEQCVFAQDPYCSWSLNERKCVFGLQITKKSLINDMNQNNSKCKPERRLISKPIKSSEQLDINLDDLYFRNKNKFGNIFDQGTELERSLTQSAWSGKNINTSPSNTALYLVLLILITFFTFLASVFLTCLFIRKNFVISSVNLVQTESQQPQKSIFKQNILELVYKYVFARENKTLRDYTEKLDINCMQQKPSKTSNLYEISNKSGGLKPVSVVCSRPNSSSSSSDLPATATTTTSSSIGSNNNSPNNLCGTLFTNLLTTSKFSSIDGDITSTSEDNFEPVGSSSMKKIKRSYQVGKQIGGDSNVTANLLMPGPNNNKNNI